MRDASAASVPIEKQKAADAAAQADASHRATGKKNGEETTAKRSQPDQTATVRGGKRGGKSSASRQRIVIDKTTTAAIEPAPDAKTDAGDRRFSAIVAQHAASNGVPVSLAHAVIRIESNYRPHARGRAGEVGLMQIKPATARMMGYRGSAKGLFDPETNIRYGMKYLGMAHKLGGGATCATILRYNAGHAARRMNPVSSAYCRKVQRELAS